MNALVGVIVGALATYYIMTVNLGESLGRVETVKHTYWCVMEKNK